MRQRKGLTRHERSSSSPSTVDPDMRPDLGFYYSCLSFRIKPELELTRRRAGAKSGLFQADALDLGARNPRDAAHGLADARDDDVGERAVRRGELDVDVHVIIDDVDVLDES